MSLPNLGRTHAPAEGQRSHDTLFTLPPASSAAGLYVGTSSLQVQEVHDATPEEFFADMRAMCALIDEADRYGTTPSMEEEYRRLRSCLSLGFRSLEAQYPDVLSAGGFHGCGFEMILSSYDLDALVRNSGRRAVDRLTDVWRAVCAAATPA